MNCIAKAFALKRVTTKLIFYPRTSASLFVK